MRGFRIPRVSNPEAPRAPKTMSVGKVPEAPPELRGARALLSGAGKLKSKRSAKLGGL